MPSGLISNYSHSSAKSEAGDVAAWGAEDLRPWGATPSVNVFGTVLARYTQVVKWCYTGIPWAPYAGGNITWIDRARRGTTFSLGWDSD
jgi:hypothetical protein